MAWCRPHVAAGGEISRSGGGAAASTPATGSKAGAATMGIGSEVPRGGLGQLVRRSALAGGAVVAVLGRTVGSALARRAFFFHFKNFYGMNPYAYISYTCISRLDWIGFDWIK